MDAPVALSPADPEAEMATSGRPRRLGNRSFVLLLTAQAISQVGSPAFNYGAIVWIMAKKESNLLMGLLGATFSIVAIIFAPLGGTFADRYSRSRIMMWTDLLSGGAILAFAGTLWVGSASMELLRPLLFGVVMAVNVSQAFFRPAEGAIIPDLVPEEREERANALNQFFANVSTSLGRALSAPLRDIFGSALVFFLNGASYLFAALCVLFIPPGRPSPQKAGTSKARIKDGFVYLWNQKGQRNFLVVVAFVNFLAMLGLFQFPFRIGRYLSEMSGLKESTWTSLLIASFSFGAGLVSFLLAVGKWTLKGEDRVKGVLAALVLYPISFGSLAVWSNPLLMLAALMLCGICSALINVNLDTLNQTLTRKELRGRVMSLVRVVAGGLVPLGIALGGLLSELSSVLLGLKLSALLALLSVFLLAFGGPCREFLASEPLVDGDV